MVAEIVPLRPKYPIEFENLICDCDCETFFISVNMKAVCTECRAWMTDEVNLDISTKD